ncbi:MAG: DNA-protecting protein DprA, partial [Bacillota bacterium]|nr:DNA-protecting protein DprA [Bacillota bacterium]
KEIELCNKNRVYLVDYYSKYYPPLLRKTPEPPLVLYVLGDKSCLTSDPVALVGCRLCDSYGLTVAQDLGREFATKGYSIVSGMAVGIDSASMLGAINAGGKVIGVLGCGPDIDYPQESAMLRNKILSGAGALISEYEFGTPPLSSNFPFRNRILSGMSHLTVMVQGTIKSGALITARLSAEQGRETASVPGPINSPLSGGTNLLIADGITPVISIDGFVEDFANDHPVKDSLALHQAEKEINVPEEKIEPKESKEPKENIETKENIVSGNREVKKTNKSESKESDNMSELLKVLKEAPATIDELCKKTGRDSKWISSTLIILEVSGKVKSMPGGSYSAL